MIRILSLSLASLLLVPTPSNARPAPHRAVADWARVVTETPDGGIRMGNPAAKVKLVEYFSFTCPHCAVFAGEAFGPIARTYVKTGGVSFEMRSALRDRIDYVAAQVARCGGPAKAFGDSETILADQTGWEQKAIDWDNAHRADFGAAGAGPAMHALATGSGLAAIVGKRGVTPAALTRCFADKTVQATLQKTTNDAWNVRKISGTPGFFLNDVYQDSVFSWADLEPRIQAALK